MAMTRRRPARASSRLRRLLRDNGLSFALGALFLLSLIGQTLAGHATHNAERKTHGQQTVAYWSYLRSSHFAEATFENWESEFLQMAAYVVLTMLLFQRGSAESRDPDGQEEGSKSRPRDASKRPWPVRRGGLARRLYEHSLGTAFGLIFVASFALHAISGARLYSEDQQKHGEPPISAPQYLVTSQFWFESFQNWQSEFLAILAMVVLSIFLRQKDSPESKDVESPHSQTGS
jgi:Domain of unknown function (DUF6766)